MDTQKCYLIYQSYNYNYEQVRLQWSQIAEPVFPLEKITLPDYDIVKMQPEVIHKTTEAGTWQILRTVFVFRRRYIWYFLQAYIPAYLTIFISWVSFTLGAKAVPARTVLGVNALLAMILLFGNIMKDLPRVSYVKAIDVWLLGCMSFIFASLMELAIVGYLASKENPLETPAHLRRHYYYYVYHHYYTPHKSTTQAENQAGINSWKDILEKKMSAEAIDKISSVLFPACFSLFNVVYWSYYSI